MTLKDWLEAVSYRITEGSSYGWNCYPNAHRLDAEFALAGDNNYAEVVFSTTDHIVYEITASDYINHRFYRWINPTYRDSHGEESRRRGFDPNIVFDNEVYIDIEVEADILEKLRAITEGRPYDDRVQIELDLTEAEQFRLMQLAHEQDITLNQMVEQLLQEVIDRHEPPIKKADEWEFA